MTDFYCKGDCGEVFFYKDGEPKCILTCKKPLKDNEICKVCFTEPKDTSGFCKHLRDKKAPLYPQGCQHGNTTSPLWCEKKERCHYFEYQV